MLNTLSRSKKKQGLEIVGPNKTNQRMAPLGTSYPGNGLAYPFSMMIKVSLIGGWNPKMPVGVWLQQLSDKKGMVLISEVVRLVDYGH